MPQDSDIPEARIPCSECGDLIKASKAYFTGIDGRALPLPECHCVRCHERLVAKSTRIAEGETKVIKTRFGR